MGWTETNRDLSGQAMCAVDIHSSDNHDARVNGVVFSVSEIELTQLLIREQGYELIETQFYDFENDQELEICRVFSANKHDGTYDFKGAAQARYLQICIDSSKQWGERFYKEFVNTTYINGKLLKEMPELLAKF